MKAMFLGVIASLLASSAALAQDGALAVPHAVAITPAMQIAVTAVARQTRIDFYEDRAKTGEYYFQTRISVRDADQVRVREGDDRAP
jgi:hypothetical protein